MTASTLMADMHAEGLSGRFSKAVIVLLLGAPMIVTAFFLLPEITLSVANLNDDAFHFTLIKNMSDALVAGRSPLDVWMPEMELGFPAAFYYQHLPHLVVVLLDRVTFGFFDLFTIFNVVRFVLMVGFPLVVFWSMRRMEFPIAAAAVAAAASSLIAGDYRYGFEYDSYIWRGWGMYTQLWAMNLSFITLACAYRTINRGTGYVWAIAALSILVLSHLLYAYMMVITLGLVAVVGAGRATITSRIARLAIIGISMAVITAYQWLPWITNSQYLGASPNLQPYKYDSFGAPAVLGWLFTGDLLDHGRLPVLTLLLGLGLVAATVYRARFTILAVVGFVLWLVLYFGRPTLGPLFDVLPLPNGILLHRFIGSVEIFAIMLMGLGGRLVWRVVSRLMDARGMSIRSFLRPVVAGAVLVAILLPAVVERAKWYSDNAAFMTTTSKAVAADVGLQAIVGRLSGTEGGRVYAGLRGQDWGKELVVGDLIVANVLIANNIPVAGPEIGGFSLNAPLMWWFRDQDPAQYDLVDARYVVTPASLTVPDFYRLVLDAGRYKLFSVPSTGATEYVAIASRQRAASATALFDANLAWFISDQPGAKQFIRWDYLKPLGPQETSAGCPGGGKTLFEHDTTDAIHVVVECPAAAALIFKVTYHPNWTVTVDKQPVETFMVSPSYVGINLPAGRHQVDAVYQPAPIKLPLLIVGLIGLLLAVIFRARFDWLPARLANLRIRRQEGEPSPRQTVPADSHPSA